MRAAQQESAPSVRADKPQVLSLLKDIPSWRHEVVPADARLTYQPRIRLTDSPLKSPLHWWPSGSPDHLFPHSLRFSCLSVLLASIGFLCFATFAHDQYPNITEHLTTSIVITLCVAIFLNTYALHKVRREHRAADLAFQNIDSEFSSIFRNILDAVLIVDHKGECLDANPSAALLLRITPHQLIGRDISRFLTDWNDFNQKWKSLLNSHDRRGRLQLTAGDNTRLIVDYVAITNYLPGRHALILCDVTERTQSEIALRESEQRFRYMADNIQEVFWMMDAATQEITYVNPAYGMMTGNSVESLRQNPTSYRDLIHPKDKARVFSRIADLGQRTILDEEFRFIRADGQVRWAWAKGNLITEDGEERWIIGTAQDITSRKQAELEISQQLEAVELARTEAEGLRKATLALTQNLAMDSVLDTLLQCIHELIPFDRAAVLFVEDGPELMVAREAPRIVPKRIGLSVKVSENIFLQRILFEKQAILLSDILEVTAWQDIPPFERVRSWLGIPLIAGNQVLGILSLAAHPAFTFTTEHLRMAKSLAVPATVAIQNARIHERAEIYASELELRLEELKETQKALAYASRKPSDPNASPRI